jgi:uncharacterized iron-regulated membrane protein
VVREATIGSILVEAPALLMVYPQVLEKKVLGVVEASITRLLAPQVAQVSNTGRKRLLPLSALVRGAAAVAADTAVEGVMVVTTAGVVVAEVLPRAPAAMEHKG